MIECISFFGMIHSPAIWLSNKKKCTQDPTWTSSLIIRGVKGYDIHLQIISRKQLNSN